MYAASFLTGLASDWFEPYLDGAGEHDVTLDSWVTFKDSLETMFGDSNVEATAEFKLDSLRMKDNEQISSYLTKFRTYAKDTFWEDAALRYNFRKGLPARVLDRVAEMDIDNTFEGLVEASKKVDNRHWEREREKKLYSKLHHSTDSHAATAQKPKGPYSPSNSYSRPSNTYSRPSNFSSRPSNSFNRPNTSTSGSMDKNKKSDRPLDKVLTKEGKLTADEKSRRAAKGLCGYCGQPHPIEKCPVKPSTAHSRIASTDAAATSEQRSGKV